MVVTDIVRIDKKKSCVYIDYEKAFVLYNSEIKSYKMEINGEVRTDIYNEIMTEILPKRCMERAVYILKDSDKSEYILRDKLSKGGYPLEITDAVIEKLKEYSYINDKRYAANYVKYNISSKSRNRIISELYAKGINKELIQNVFDESEYDDEKIGLLQIQLIKKEFSKKKYDFLEEDKNLLNKIIASLMRKGFKYEDIMSSYYEMKRDSEN